jgi:formylglycine-generating enzyme required for sulfatase activity
MKKVFILLATALLAEGVFGEELNNAPANGDKYTCTIKGVAFEMIFVEGSGSVSSFWIGKFVVTQQQWEAVYGSWPETAPSDTYGKGNSYPAYYISWEKAQAFIVKLNAAVGGGKFRLPTEREWEYAARGGSAAQTYKYAGSDDLDAVGWYTEHPNIGSSKKTHPVGELAANGIGAYDMSGNVWEWCEDWLGGETGENPMPATPPTTGTYHIFRGGGWTRLATNCTVSFRHRNVPGRWENDVGFRLACSSN